MYIVISRFRVRNGLEEEVRLAFLARPRLVENADGFRGLEVFSQADDPSAFVLVTRWDSKDDFDTWRRRIMPSVINLTRILGHAPPTDAIDHAIIRQFEHNSIADRLACFQQKRIKVLSLG